MNKKRICKIGLSLLIALSFVVPVGLTVDTAVEKADARKLIGDTDVSSLFNDGKHEAMALPNEITGQAPGDIKFKGLAFGHGCDIFDVVPGDMRELKQQLAIVGPDSDQSLGIHRQNHAQSLARGQCRRGVAGRVTRARGGPDDGTGSLVERRDTGPGAAGAADQTVAVNQE